MIHRRFRYVCPDLLQQQWEKDTPCSCLCKIGTLKISGQAESCFQEVLLFLPEHMSTSNFGFEQEALTLRFCWGRAGPANLAVNNPRESEKCGPERRVSRYRFRTDQGGGVKLDRSTCEHAESPRLTP